MARVLGIGGIFFHAASPEATRAWYARVLGFELTKWGGVKFPPLPTGGQTVWSAFPPNSKHFEPSTASWMLNLVVDDLDAVLAHAKAEGVEPLSRDDSDAFGRFAWLLDPDGIKLELWQPNPPASDALPATGAK